MEKNEKIGIDKDAGEIIARKNLGQKVRQRRRELHMTQAEVCGDFITRNMLSRIERGAINPSLTTLRFLIERLRIPAGYLLSDDEDLSTLHEQELREAIRESFRSGDYDCVLELCDAYRIYDDEACLMLCICALSAAKDAYVDGAVQEALRMLDLAMVYSDKTIYPTDVQKAEVHLYRSIFSVISDRDPKDCLAGYASIAEDLAERERYTIHRFLFLLDCGDDDAAFAFVREIPFRNMLYRDMIQAWICAARGENTEAVHLFSVIIDGDTEQKFRQDPFLYYRCVGKLESLAAEAGDYRIAYRCATEKQRFERMYKEPFRVMQNSVLTEKDENEEI